MVSPLDGVNGLARIAGLVRSAVQQRTGEAVRGKGNSGSAATGRASGEALPVMLERRLKEIRGDDATRKRLLVRMLIESVLLEQFSHELGAEAEFQGVVDDVVRVIEETDGLREDLEKVVATVLAGR